MTELQPTPQPKKSDLPVRAASAVVMVAVAGTALWLGEWWWTVFVAAVAWIVVWEWRGLTAGFEHRTGWNVIGLIYIFVAAGTAWNIRLSSGLDIALILIAVVVAVDIGAYFAGRAIGGPKIAPRISPSKTWAGLLGGALAASIVWLIAIKMWHVGVIFIGTDLPDAAPQTCFGIDYCAGFYASNSQVAALSLAMGLFFAVCAQAGDFFESWMKRRAGVKDSGTIIPGHGGVFDRVDGLLSVMFVLGLLEALRPI